VETSEPVRRSSEIEEFTNLHIIHPISSFLTPIFAKLGITPNAVSLAGMGFGILAGFAYYQYRQPGWAVAGFALMIAWHVMDGADGQLARLTNAQSEMGKILDGICDYVTFTAVYSALAASLTRDMGAWVWGLAIASAISHALQSAAYEAQRQEYNYWGLGRKSAALTLPPRGDSPGPMTLLYRLYVRAQLGMSGISVSFRDRLAIAIAMQPEREALIRAHYRAIFAPAVRRWSIMSANYRTLGIFIAAAGGRPDYYFWFEIFGFSAILALLIARQRTRYTLLFKSLGEP
jgi:phosphatidylglycerophosphate synthase